MRLCLEVGCGRAVVSELGRGKKKKKKTAAKKEKKLFVLVPRRR